MKRKIIFPLLLLLAAGCNEVEDRLAWSPDGKQAVLQVEGWLYLMEASGNLSAAIASNVTGAAWLPDSRGLVLTRLLLVDKWKNAENLLPPDEIAAAQNLAKGFLVFGDEGMQQFKLERPELASPAFLYLFDTQSNALHEAVQKTKDPAKLEADLSNMRTTQVAEVSIVTLAGKPLRVIERTVTELSQPQPSTTSPVVAFQRGETLTVAPLDGSTNRVVVTDKLIGSFGWTADGRALLYAARVSEKDNNEITLARIGRHSVINTNATLNDGEKLPLSLNASTFMPRVKCLPDGRAIFAGTPMQLPTPSAAASGSSFFLIDPARGTNASPLAVPCAAGMLPQDLASFAPSPDGKRIAIVESGSDAVAVLDVTTGALEVISPKRGWKSKMLPAWRGTNELYFAALPAESSARPELLRWRKGQSPQIVSSNWSDAVVASLLEKPSK